MAKTTKETKTTEKQLNKSQELKLIQKEKKALLEKQRALQEELNANREERKEARKAQAQARKDVRTSKAQLAKCTSTIYAKFSEGEIETINTLADDIMEHATALSQAVRVFAEAEDEML